MGHEKESAAVNGAGNTSGRELHSTHLNFSKRPSICQRVKLPERPKMRPNRKFYRDFLIRQRPDSTLTGNDSFSNSSEKGSFFMAQKQAMTDEQRERRNEYVRRYRAANPERVRKWRIQQALNVAERVKAQQEQLEGGER